MRSYGLHRRLLLVALALAAGCAPLCAPDDERCLDLRVAGSGAFSNLDIYLTHDVRGRLQRQHGQGFDIAALPLQRRLPLPDNVPPPSLRAVAVVATARQTGVQTGGALAASAAPGSSLSLEVPMAFTFARLDVGVGGPQNQILAADMNQDGTPDLLTLHDWPLNQVHLTHLKPDGSVLRGPARYDVLPLPRRMAVGRLNQDGFPDVAVGSLFSIYEIGTGAPMNTISYTSLIRFGIGQPDGTLGSFVDRAVNQTGPGNGWTQFLLADVDGDGQSDVLGATSAPPVMCALGVQNIVAVAKLPPQPAGVALPAPPAVSYAAQQIPLCAAGATDLLTVDVNGDNRLDLVIVSISGSVGQVELYLNDGAGAFSPLLVGGAPKTYLVGTQASAVAAGDFDRDGDLDLAILSPDRALLLVLFNRQVEQGVLNFEVRESQVLGTSPGGSIHVVAEDFDRDGVLDLAVAEYSEHRVSLLRGHGDGTFAPPVPLAVGQLPFRLAVADIDGDALPDLLVANSGSPFATLLLNRAPPP